MEAVEVPWQGGGFSSMNFFQRGGVFVLWASLNEGQPVLWCLWNGNGLAHHLPVGPTGPALLSQSLKLQTKEGWNESVWGSNFGPTPAGLQSQEARAL